MTNEQMQTAIKAAGWLKEGQLVEAVELRKDSVLYTTYTVRLIAGRDETVLVVGYDKESRKAYRKTSGAYLNTKTQLKTPVQSSLCLKAMPSEAYWIYTGYNEGGRGTQRKIKPPESFEIPTVLFGTDAQIRTGDPLVVIQVL